MMENKKRKKYNEEDSLKSFDKIGKVNLTCKTLMLRNDTHVGIKVWAAIDYLTHYKGWTLEIKEKKYA